MNLLNKYKQMLEESRKGCGSVVLSYDVGGKRDERYYCGHILKVSKEQLFCNFCVSKISLLTEIVKDLENGEKK